MRFNAAARHTRCGETGKLKLSPWVLLDVPPTPAVLQGCTRSQLRVLTEQWVHGILAVWQSDVGLILHVLPT